MFQIREICLELGISTEEELYTILSFYHDMGTLIYLGGGDRLDCALNNLVIVQPSWLVNMVSKVITANPQDTAVSGILVMYMLMYSKELQIRDQ